MALIRAGGDVTKYWHWRALRTLGFASGICQSRTGASKWPFLPFSLSVTIEEKREGEPQVVSFLSRLFPVSVMIVISSPDLFLVNRDPYGKIEKKSLLWVQ